MADYTMTASDGLDHPNSAPLQHGGELNPIGGMNSGRPGTVYEFEINSGNYRSPGPVKPRRDQYSMELYRDQPDMDMSEVFEAWNSLFHSGEEMSLEEKRLWDLMRIIKRFPESHIGDLGPNNASADIPECQNTAVWLTELPGDTTVASLLATLAAVGPTGKIYATVVNEPNSAKGLEGAAAKIVFWNRQGALRLRDTIIEERLAFASAYSPGFYRVPRFQWSRVRSAAQPDSILSRVLLIRGPPFLVNARFLSEFFNGKFRYETEFVHLIRVTQCEVILEWAFGSYLCQANAAAAALQKEFEGTITTCYGRDPCAETRRG